MILRSATIDDLPRLHALTAHFLASTPYGNLLREPSEVRLFGLVEQVLESGVILVAELDGQIEAMLAAVALEHPVSGEPYADELVWWVEPEHRGSSIGPRLLDLAEAWAVSNGLTMLKMVAPSGSTALAAFYVHMGYHAVETAYVKPLSTTVTFRRSVLTMPTQKQPSPGDRGPQPATQKPPTQPTPPTPRTPGAQPAPRQDDDR